MRDRAIAMVAALLAAAYLTAATALAQSASIEGRIVDEQSLAVPGVAVTLMQPATGFSRQAVSDEQGSYRIPGLGPGFYDIRAALDGFTTVEQRGTAVEVAAVVRVDFHLRVAAVAETIGVVAPSPLVQPGVPVVGGVVDQRRIAELPLNGRQFANLAATLPGVGLGFHRDPTKSTQYMPQVNGGNGRNVAYVVDGADNIDDTVGGPLQQFPLDAIEEFRFSNASYGAEHGRASGGVLSVVTKSGANQVSGSAFDLIRHESLNSRTTSETILGVDKPDYRRSQFGGSLGGPLVENRAHFFGAAERVQQPEQRVGQIGLRWSFGQ
jgi:Carboxypeptidase regulatory-like domain